MDGQHNYGQAQDGQYNYSQSQLYGGPQTHLGDDGSSQHFVTSPDQSYALPYQQSAAPFAYTGTTGPGRIQFSDFTSPDSAEPVSASRRRAGRWKRCRTGCYTCRRRRVKCDENKPVCKRCKTGNRECLWPEPVAEPDRAQTNETAEGDDVSSQGEDEDESQDGSVPPIDLASPVITRRPSIRESSSTPALTPNTGTTSSAEMSNASVPPRPADQGERPSDLKMPAHLANKMARFPQDVRFFLWYARQHLSSAHYGFKIERGNFLTDVLMRAALEYEPLLYALVGFASYHYTIRKYHGKITQFTVYYNKSINLLRKSMMKSKNECTIAILLTSLQLATIEEFLGDWEVCRKHSAAACHNIRTLYTPQEMVSGSAQRMILQWYMRFNIYLAVIGGQQGILGMDWVEANHAYLLQQVKEHPDDVSLKYEERYGLLRVLGSKISSLQGAVKNNLFDSKEDFEREWDALSSEIAAFADSIDPTLMDRDKQISIDELSCNSPDQSEDTHQYYDGDIYPTNQLLVDYWLLDIMYNGHLAALHRGTPRSQRIYDLADRVCHVIDAMPRHPRSPPGVLLAYQTAISIIASNLRETERNSLWSRRMLAEIETQGYIWPEEYRRQMSRHWGVDVTEWWLPDGELRTPIIKELRNHHAQRQESNREPAAQANEDILNMSGIFKSVSLSDTPSPDRGGTSTGMGTTGSPARGIIRRGTTASDTSMISNNAAHFGPPSEGSSHLDFEAMLLDDQHLSDFRWDSLHEQQPWGQT